MYAYLKGEITFRAPAYLTLEVNGIASFDRFLITMEPVGAALENPTGAVLLEGVISADLLVLLTDTPGLLTADPRIDNSASLIEEIRIVDREIEALAGGAATAMSQGGMASKLSAAKIASWSGVDAIIAAAHRPSVLVDAVTETSGVGTLVRARDERLNARKLWIAFALASTGTITVDAGAREALLRSGGSLLAVGVTGADGDFAAGDAVEVVGPDGEVFAKGLAGHGATDVRAAIGERSVDVIHRDDFVLLPDAVRSA